MATLKRAIEHWTQLLNEHPEWADFHLVKKKGKSFEYFDLGLCPCEAREPKEDKFVFKEPSDNCNALQVEQYDYLDHIRKHKKMLQELEDGTDNGRYNVIK